jgi:hypothetical protein
MIKTMTMTMTVTRDCCRPSKVTATVTAHCLSPVRSRSALGSRLKEMLLGALLSLAATVTAHNW